MDILLPNTTFHPLLVFYQKKLLQTIHGHTWLYKEICAMLKGNEIHHPMGITVALQNK